MSSDDPNIGRVLAGKYELVRLLGQGGMGAVYEGRNPLGKRIAVKLLLKSEFAENNERTSRFLREAKASVAIESRHVVDVYETGVDADTGYPFIIMAFLHGEDLEGALQRLGALNPVAAARIVCQAATGLAKAHEMGIVHRDIKPANLFLVKEDDNESVVKVLDFGIAKLETDALMPSASDGTLTRTGAMLGTPLYMSPEQAQGLKTIDHRTDVWSLGMCLYQALSGKPPFAGVDTIGKLIVAIVAKDVPSLSEIAPWVSPELAAVVHQCLQRDVANRLSGARELIAALAPFTNGSHAVTPDILFTVEDARAVSTSVLAASLATGPTIRASTLRTPATTAGTSNDQPIAVAPPRQSPTRRVLPIGVASLAVVGVAVAAFFLRAPSGEGKGAPEPPKVVRAQSGAVDGATLPERPRAPDLDDTKAGTLTVKMPAGFTVKVDGQVPGTPECHGAPKPLADGKLELRGDFQTRFIVGVYDRQNKPVMRQEVYLYDNKLDPDSIDTNVGEVKVVKPRRQPGANPASGPFSTSSGTPTTSSASPAASELPPRF